MNCRLDLNKNVDGWNHDQTDCSHLKYENGSLHEAVSFQVVLLEHALVVKLAHLRGILDDERTKG